MMNTIVSVSNLEKGYLSKKEIGIVPQDIAIFEEITAEKNVQFFAGFVWL